jgi:hypothetical protein
MNATTYLKELHRTNPDYVVFAPPFEDRYNNFGNEECHVISLKNGEMLAFWTQSHVEGSFTQRPAMARSYNGGVTWTEPIQIAGHDVDGKTGAGMASWICPVLSKSGKIYAIYNKQTGKEFFTTHQHGLMCVIASTDNGATWTEEAEHPLPRSIWDHPDQDIPSNWVIWQMPIRLSNGTVLGALSRWFCNTEDANDGEWFDHESGIEFFRIENIDDDPEAKDLTFSFFAQNESIVTAPTRSIPPRRVAQEPCMVELPDQRLFCVMRTNEGHVWYTLSDDFGETWSETRMLRFYDGGPGIEHPLSPAPLYRVSNEGEFILLYHNHDGHFGPFQSQQRRSMYASRGVYKPDADQPIHFSVPMFFFDTNNHEAGYGDKGLSLYGSMSYEEDGTPVLWYPDRKHFLLGKRVDMEELRSLKMLAN